MVYTVKPKIRGWKVEELARRIAGILVGMDANVCSKKGEPDAWHIDAFTNNMWLRRSPDQKSETGWELSTRYGLDDEVLECLRVLVGPVEPKVR